MRSLLMLLATLWAYNLSANFQEITLKPNACSGKDALIASCVPCGYANQNFGNHNELTAVAWTNSGALSVIRSLFEFNLSALPDDAVLVSAELSLFHNPSPQSEQEGHNQGPSGNSATIKRITQPWSESSVTWNNQPATSELNVIYLSNSISDDEDYININVTDLVEDMLTNPTEAYGFMLQLENENPFTSLVFASSDHMDESLHPVLTISYTSNKEQTCFFLKPDDNTCGNGIDALVANCVSCGFDNSNFGTLDEFSALAWTNSGNPSIIRSFINFEMDNIPVGSEITNAHLKLYHLADPQTGNLGHSQISGSNNAVLSRVIEPWVEEEITWNNQPDITTLNQVQIEASSSSTQDYVIDITELMQDAVDFPENSYGYRLSLVNENYYRSLLFASSDYINPALHPELEVCFTTPGSVSVHSVKKREKGIHVYPNPANSFVTVVLDGYSANSHFYIVDNSGKIVQQQALSASENQLNVGDLAPGQYTLIVQDQTEIRHNKLLVY